MPRGGARIGAGRKPKPKVGFDLAQVLRHPSSAMVPVAESEPAPAPDQVDVPADLLPEVKAVWLKQAPHALASRTLTRATALAFERYCKIVVFEAAEANSSARGGANHRGLLKQLNAYELQFMLMPAGKPMVEPVKAVVDEDDAFFGGVSAGVSG